MQTNRSKRMLAGTACLVAAALVMGWFIGQYVPGVPREPQPQPLDGLTEGSGLAARSVVDRPAGSTLELRGVVQGYAYRPGADSVANGAVERYQQVGLWEYECPDVDVSVDEIRIVPTESFAAWYPQYYSSQDSSQAPTTYNDSAIVAVTVTVANASQNPIGDWQRLPQFTLWSENLARLDDAMGAGAMVDSSFYLVNDRLRPYDEDSDDPEYGTYVDLDPGESQTVVLPFKVNKNNLIDQSAFDELDPSGFCIQTADYAAQTAYRLWL